MPAPGNPFATNGMIEICSRLHSKISFDYHVAMIMFSHNNVIIK